MALYVHARPAERQFLHGLVPSPMHLTFLRWQLQQGQSGSGTVTASYAPVAGPLDGSNGGGSGGHGGAGS
jgi:hypothetical protein